MDSKYNKPDLAKRDNKGKLRYDLLPPEAIEVIVKIYTNGAKKHSEFDADGNMTFDASNNWRKGQKWMDAIASVKRHIAAFERGEDYDPDPSMGGNTFHLASACWNLMSLLVFYRTHPELDNRISTTTPKKKIGLDVDEILVDWLGGYKKKYGYDDSHEFDSWYLHYKILDRCKDEMDSNFYLNLKPKISPKDLHFEPHCYITSRNQKSEITEEWLYRNGFPCMPVYTVGLSESKVDVAKRAGIDWFVEDVYKNFLELNQAGVCCFLLDAPHNRRFDVGHKRIYSLKELMV